MNYDAWRLLFLGTVGAMLLLNVVQWVLYRERIYGLYTGYMLVWIGYFVLRAVDIPDSYDAFVRTAGPMTAYVLYFDLAIVFMGLRPQQASLLRAFRFMQAGLSFYILFEVIACFLTDWRTLPIHGILHTAARFLLIGLAIYLVIIVFRLRSTVVRFFIIGSSFLIIGGLTSMLLTIWRPAFSSSQGAWFTPLFYMQVGIILELICFSLGLTYRHRQQEIEQAVTKAIVEKELAREREQRQREQAEAELTLRQLKHEKTEMQMRALQTQINPHFLFNSLNTLSALIDNNPQQAEQFVDELSNVYRYLLRSNEGEMTTLDLELNFIRSYLGLLQTRFGNGLHTEINIDPAYHQALLPPLTLQLLVENAVKHNIILPEQPLTIGIRTNQSGWLVVENTLQRRKIRVESNGVGLSNIVSKYQLLGLTAPTFEDHDGWFRVSMPLASGFSESAQMFFL